MHRGLTAGLLIGAAAFCALAVWIVLSGRPDAPVETAAVPPSVPAEPEAALAPVTPAEPVSVVPSSPDALPSEAPVPRGPTAVTFGKLPEPTVGTGVAANLPETVPDRPVIDVLRVDAEGRTVIAGRAPAGSPVDILLDRTVVGEAVADETGTFVALLDLPPSDEARALRLRIPAPPEAAWRPASGWASRPETDPLATVVWQRAPGAAENASARSAAPDAPVRGARAAPLPSPDRPAAPGWWSQAPGMASQPAAAPEAIAALAPEVETVSRLLPRGLARPGAAPPIAVPMIRDRSALALGEDGAKGELTGVSGLHPGRPAQPADRGDDAALAVAGATPDPQARAAPPIAPWRPGGPGRALRRSPLVPEDAVPADDLPPPTEAARTAPAFAGNSPAVPDADWRMPAQGRISDWPDRDGRRLDRSARLRAIAPPLSPRFVPAIPQRGLAPERPHVLPGRPGTIQSAMPETVVALLAAERPLPTRLTAIGRIDLRPTDAGPQPAGPALPPTPSPGGDAERPRPLSPEGARFARAPDPNAPAGGPAFRLAPGPLPKARLGLSGQEERSARVRRMPTGESWQPEPGSRAAAPANRYGAPVGDEPHYLLSAPVLILPIEGADSAPLLVQPTPEAIALLQAPAPAAPGLLLDSLTHPKGGSVTARGRGRPGHAVRLYVNTLYQTEVPVAADGSWQLSMPREAGEAARLLRFDEVDAGGQVTTRVEVPFSYTAGPAALRISEREVEIQRGDHLWRLAEQHYGEGLRYSLIFEANAGLIRNPDLIYPGQVFRVPELIAD
ncbi:MAG: LysM peptidoglycan-binding domain-containing protein [Pseudomonadota bacterium]